MATRFFASSFVRLEEDRENERIEKKRKTAWRFDAMLMKNEYKHHGMIFIRYSSIISREDMLLGKLFVNAH